MEKNFEFEAEILDISSDGFGVAKYNGEVVFVQNAIPGEVCKIKVINTKTKFAIGKVLEYVSKSEIRQEPMCPYFLKCGGCNLQHIKYENQLNYKTQMVKNCLQKYAGINFDVLPCEPSNLQYNYRNKFALPVVCENDETKIGFYKVASHKIIEVDDCLIQKKSFKIILNLFKNYIKENKLKGYNEILKQGDIKHLVVRELENKFLVTIVATRSSLPNVKNFYNSLTAELGEVGLNININKLNNNVILTNNYKHCFGFEELNIIDNNLNVNVNANSFYQVNSYIQNKIYSYVNGCINPNATVINAYSGAGLLTAILSKNAKFVYGVEIVESATKNANFLIDKNNIKNVENVNGDCATIIPELVKKLKTETYVVLDPPRKGCAESVLNAIKNSNTNKIIYISCNPSTLSRDIKLLLEGDCYEFETCKPFDMFPQTKHVETVAVIKRKL